MGFSVYSLRVFVVLFPFVFFVLVVVVEARYKPLYYFFFLLEVYIIVSYNKDGSYLLEVWLHDVCLSGCLLLCKLLTKHDRCRWPDIGLVPFYKLMY